MCGRSFPSNCLRYDCLQCAHRSHIVVGADIAHLDHGACRFRPSFVCILHVCQHVNPRCPALMHASCGALFKSKDTFFSKVKWCFPTVKGQAHG